MGKQTGKFASKIGWEVGGMFKAKKKAPEEGEGEEEGQQPEEGKEEEQENKYVYEREFDKDEYYS